MIWDEQQQRVPPFPRTASGYIPLHHSAAGSANKKRGDAGNVALGNWQDKRTDWLADTAVKGTSQCIQYGTACLQLFHTVNTNAPRMTKPFQRHYSRISGCQIAHHDALPEGARPPTVVDTMLYDWRCNCLFRPSLQPLHHKSSKHVKEWHTTFPLPSTSCILSSTTLYSSQQDVCYQRHRTRRQRIWRAGRVHDLSLIHI